MNDFTSNLIARHERLGEFVKPRIQHKFESEYTEASKLSLTPLQEQEQTRPTSTPDQISLGTDAVSLSTLSISNTKKFREHNQSAFALRAEQGDQQQPMASPISAVTVLPSVTTSLSEPNEHPTLSNTGMMEQPERPFGSGKEIIRTSERSSNVLSAKTEHRKPDTGQGIKNDPEPSSDLFERTRNQLTGKFGRKPEQEKNFVPVKGKTPEKSSSAFPAGDPDDGSGIPNNADSLSGLFVRLIPELAARSEANGATPRIAMAPNSGEAERGKRQKSEQLMSPAFPPAKPVTEKNIQSELDYQDSLPYAKGESLQQKKQSEAEGLFGIPTWLSSYNNSFAEERQNKKTEQPSQKVINVTIGRVEVRATRSEAKEPAKKKAKPARQVMSLEEYLKQRG